MHCTGCYTSDFYTKSAARYSIMLTLHKQKTSVQKAFIKLVFQHKIMCSPDICCGFQQYQDSEALKESQHGYSITSTTLIIHKAMTRLVRPLQLKTLPHQQGNHILRKTCVLPRECLPCVSKSLKSELSSTAQVTSK